MLACTGAKACPQPGHFLVPRAKAGASRAFPACKSACHTCHPRFAPGSRQWGPGQGVPEGAPAWENVQGGGVLPGGAGARDALPAPDTRRRPRSSLRWPPPPPRSRSRSPSRSGGGGGTRPDKFPARLRAAGGGASGARTPRPPRVPTTFLRAGGDRGAPRRAAGGRPGDAEPPRRRDRRDRTGPSEVSARGVRAGAVRPSGGGAPRAARTGRGRRLCRRGGREGPRRGAGSRSPVLGGPEARRVPEAGDGATLASAPRNPRPTWPPPRRLSRSPSGNGHTERVSAGGDGARGWRQGRR